VGAVDGQVVNVVADAELFPKFGSGVGELTVAVLVTVPDPDTEYVACTLWLCPALRLPIEQGNELHAPLAETNVRPDGVGSLSDTLVASEGPPLVTVIVYTMFVPAGALEGPLLVTLRSALMTTVLVVVELLFPKLLSKVLALTDAVFVTVPLALEGTA
jgi:hypothetical protein